MHLYNAHSFIIVKYNLQWKASTRKSSKEWILAKKKSNKRGHLTIHNYYFNVQIELEILQKTRSLASDFMQSYLISKVDDASESMVNFFYHLEYNRQNGKIFFPET